MLKRAALNVCVDVATRQLFIRIVKVQTEPHDKKDVAVPALSPKYTLLKSIVPALLPVVFRDIAVPVVSNIMFLNSHVFTDCAVLVGVFVCWPMMRVLNVVSGPC